MPHLAPGALRNPLLVRQQRAGRSCSRQRQTHPFCQRLLHFVDTPTWYWRGGASHVLKRAVDFGRLQHCTVNPHPLRPVLHFRCQEVHIDEDRAPADVWHFIWEQPAPNHACAPLH